MSGWPRPGLAAILVIVTAVWLFLAVWTLVDVAAPYHYGALGHRCPLCLFLPQHGAIGYLLYGSLAVVLVDAVGSVVAIMASRTHEGIRSEASRRIRRGAFRVGLAVVVFLLGGFGPVVVWRLRHGVWLS
jgi:hypothetical protein